MQEARLLAGAKLPTEHIETPIRTPYGLVGRSRTRAQGRHNLVPPGLSNLVDKEIVVKGTMLHIKMFTTKKDKLIGMRAGSEGGVGTRTRGLLMEAKALAWSKSSLAGVLGEGLLQVLLALLTILLASSGLFLQKDKVSTK
jgi:hypothetical protein